MKYILKKIINRVNRYSSLELNKVDLNLYIKKALLYNCNCQKSLSVYIKKRIGVKRYYGVQQELIDIIVEIIWGKWHYKHDCTIYTEQLNKLIDKTSPDAIPVSIWLSLYDLLFNFGIFSSLLPLRDKAILCAYFHSSVNPNKIGVINQAFKASIDEGNFCKANRFLNVIEKKIPIYENKFTYDIFYHMQSGNPLTASDIYLKKSSKKISEVQFRNLIEGKRIAVVGPAPTGEDLGEEIDSYDVIVRINYRGLNYLGSSKEFGKRTDISYYGIEDTISLYNNNIIEKMKNSVFCVFKNRMKKYHKNAFRYIKKAESLGDVRILLNKKNAALFPNKFLFNGTLNMAQWIIYDLLLLRPKSVKLFKVNFFLSDNAYIDNFRDSHLNKKGIQENTDVFNKLDQFTYHDLISQLRFTRNLLKSNMFDCDLSCRKVLSLSDEEYLDELSIIYVNPYIAV